MDIEVISRATSCDMVNYNGMKPLSLMGYTSLWMFLVGGLCAVAIGALNDHHEFYDKHIWQQVLIGGSIITGAELISGIILNMILNLNIWYYAGKYQFLHQIELKNCILWYLVITPLVIWLDDMLTYYIYREGKPYNLLEVYKKLVLLQ